MNRKLITFLVVASMLLCSCHSNEYTPKHFDDYNEGYSDARAEYEDDYSRGYEDGHSDGYSEGFRDAESDMEHNSYPGNLSEYGLQIAMNIQEDAEMYATIDGDYDMESALVIVHSYLNNDPTYWGEIPSRSEFEDAVMTLYKFYDYFYNSEYE